MILIIKYCRKKCTVGRHGRCPCGAAPLPPLIVSAAIIPTSCRTYPESDFSRWYVFIHRWMGPCLFYRTLFEMCRVWWQLPLLGTRQDFFICFDCCFIWSRSFVTRRRNVLGHFSDASRRHRRGRSSLFSPTHRRSSEAVPDGKEVRELNWRRKWRKSSFTLHRLVWSFLLSIGKNHWFRECTAKKYLCVFKIFVCRVRGSKITISIRKLILERI